MKDEIDKFFEQHRNDFEQSLPPTGHEERFLNKLKRRKGEGRRPIRLWLPMAWAASILVAIIAGGYLFRNQDNFGPQEIVRTSAHFEQLVEEERSLLVAMNQGEVGNWYQDVETELQELQKRQKQLQTDYRRSGKDPRILQAMVQNYQMQIELLNDIKNKIQNHEKQESNEYREI